MSFDMYRIGKTISQLRREHNMTQMQLADEMNVSFQAVSNWERGQSMPDISKLPELSKLLGTTTDALLGVHAPLIDSISQDKLEDLPEITEADLVDIAPILSPKKLDNLIDYLEYLPAVPELLPFVSTDTADQFLRQKSLQNEKLGPYAVFASQSVVDEVALSREEHGLDINDMLLFMSRTKVDWLLRQKSLQNEKLGPYAVFASQSVVDEVALSREEHGLDIMPLVPFLSNDCKQTLIISRLKRRQSILPLLPFLSEAALQQLFEAACTKA